MLPAIILAGGLGTRLRTVVSEIPKPMAPVCGKPFLHYLFQYLKKQAISEVILSVGYKAELIQEYFRESYLDIAIRYAIEQEPLGTGGGIKQAMLVANSDAYILNGDTFFDVNLTTLHTCFTDRKASIALSLKHMEHFDRYGTVEIDNQNHVLQFHEKRYQDSGLINGGVYILSKNIFSSVEALEQKTLPDKFSFEKEVLEKHLNNMPYYATVFNSYFIDIGIPEDYHRAQIDFLKN